MTESATTPFTGEAPLTPNSLTAVNCEIASVLAEQKCAITSRGAAFERLQQILCGLGTMFPRHTHTVLLKLNLDFMMRSRNRRLLAFGCGEPEPELSVAVPTPGEVGTLELDFGYPRLDSPTDGDQTDSLECIAQLRVDLWGRLAGLPAPLSTLARFEFALFEIAEIRVIESTCWTDLVLSLLQAQEDKIDPALDHGRKYVASILRDLEAGRTV